MKFDEKKMEEIKTQMKDAETKIKSMTETVAAASLVAVDDLSDKLSNAKGELASAKRKAQEMAEGGEGEVRKELLKAQMTMEAAKEKVDAKKQELTKEKEKAYIEDKMDYVIACVELATIAADEANVAYLEAVEAQKEYVKKYGEK